jgi:hypothetical protein
VSLLNESSITQGVLDKISVYSIIPVLPIKRQRPGLLDKLSPRIPRRGRSLQFFQIGFEIVVGDDQRLDGLASVAAAGRDGLIGGGL